MIFGLNHWRLDYSDLTHYRIIGFDVDLTQDEEPISSLLFIECNDDDDNGNDIPDGQEDPVLGEDDLIGFDVEFIPPLGQLREQERKILEEMQETDSAAISLLEEALSSIEAP